MAILQELYGSLEIALILVKATRLRRFNEATLKSQHEFPPTSLAVNVLFNVVKELDEAHLARHVSGVVVQCGPVKERMLAVPSLQRVKVSINNSVSKKDY